MLKMVEKWACTKKFKKVTFFVTKKGTKKPSNGAGLRVVVPFFIPNMCIVASKCSTNIYNNRK